MSNEQLLLLVAVATGLAGLWTARSTSRSASAVSWGSLAEALEERVEGMADEIAALRSDIDRDRMTIAAQADTITSLKRRVTTLERELRRIGVDPDTL